MFHCCFLMFILSLLLTINKIIIIIICSHVSPNVCYKYRPFIVLVIEDYDQVEVKSIFMFLHYLIEQYTKMLTTMIYTSIQTISVTTDSFK